jgi:hypothetical protein
MNLLGTLRSPQFIPMLFLILLAAACSPRMTTDSEQPSSGGTVSGELATPTATNTETATPSLTVSLTPSPTATETVTPSATPFICPGSPTTRLEIGISAYVSLYPPYANRVRAEPSWSTGAILGLIQPGEVVDVLDGPVCANGVVWWKVQSREQNLTGWTVEGDINNYWIIPQIVLATPTPLNSQ